MSEQLETRLTRYFAQMRPNAALPAESRLVAALERGELKPVVRRAGRPQMQLGRRAQLIGLLGAAAVVTVVVAGSLGLAASHPAAAEQSADPSESPGSSGSVLPAYHDPSVPLWTAPPIIMAGSTRPPTPAPGYHATGQMPVPREGGAAALLPDGRVLLVGGADVNFPYLNLATADLFDPKTGTFSPTGSMYRAPRSAIAVTLQDGHVLVVSVNGDGDGDAELYDPSTGTFSQTGPMLRSPYLESNATRLLDGRVAFFGGGEIYNPKTGKFTEMATATTSPERVVRLADGRVLVIGSADLFEGNGLSYVTRAEIYDPTADRFTALGATNVAYPVAGVTLADGRVLLVEQETTQIYDPVTRAFTDPRPIGLTVAGASVMDAVTLRDGRVLVRTLSLNDPPTDTPNLIYKPTTDTFATAAVTARAPYYLGTATVLDDGRVLYANDGRSNGLLYDPSSNTFSMTAP